MLRRVGRALLLRCPNCGSRGVVRPLARVAATCPGCGHRFEREEGYWLGAVLLSTAATVILFGGLFVVLTVSTWPDPPWGLIAGITIGVNLLFPVLFHPFARMLWVALDLAFHPAGDRPGTAPADPPPRPGRARH
jgi:uncharacterized protein (DUF983 family)